MIKLKTTFFKSIVVALIFSSFFSCTKDKSAKPVTAADLTEAPEQIYCDTATIMFSSQVLPIFLQSCATSGCHNSGAAAGYTLLNYSQIESNATILLSSIKRENGSTMPKNQPKLHDSLIQQFECWISQGKANN